MAKKIVPLLLILALLGSVCGAVSADQMPDQNRTGSISVGMAYHGQSVPGGNLTIYKVADVSQEDAAFVYTAEFSTCQMPLEDLQDPMLALELEAIAREQELPGSTKTMDENGRAKFENLTIGLYLLVQTKPAPGYNKVNPFLVSLPGQREGAYIYDVDASPKVALEPEETEPTETTEPTVPTTKPPSLPQTGQLSWPVPVLAIAGLILLCIGWLMRESERRKTHES